MRISSGLPVFLMFLSAVSWTTTAQATKHPHDRSGLLVGFGVGLGGVTGVSSHGLQERGVVLAGDFRLGWALRPDLTVGYEGAAVAGEVNADAYTVGATYYPGNFGLYVRGGLGFGVASKFERFFAGDKPSLVDDPPLVQAAGSLADRSGMALLGALGFEWRLTRSFALGPQVNYFYINLGANRIHTSSGFYTTQLNWYW